MRTAAATVFLAALVLSPSGKASAETPASVVPGPKGPGLHLQVRTYDQTALAPEIRGGMRQATEAVLATAGIQLAWVSCDPGLEAASCPAPLGRHELALRLVRLAPTDTTGAVTLGYSLVNPTDRSGALATIYVDRVSRLADLSALDMPTVLGRAVAHEIGHLLLGTGGHSPAGVMRAIWSPQDLLSNRPGDWAFTPREAGQLQSALTSRRTSRQ
ncbi:MAG: hypothetical protein A3F70_11540 [Acidobacteria bacterium RIFCSPLOWO2_12_FULL_67_14]|nr:MAG: hypothetical protein A3F70_11540 [Acidobacteria bacterium RIFCSPLOWO2_12_FULL_67_14]